MKIKEMLNERYKRLTAQRDDLVKNWDDVILKPMNESIQEELGRSLSDWEKRNIATCLENALLESQASGRSMLFEETTADDVSFLGIQLPVIAAVLPSLALNEVAVMQSIDRRTASVFYFDVKYGSNKGLITAGDTMLSSTTGHARSRSGRRYAMSLVEMELIATSDGNVTGTVDYAPGLILLDQLLIKDVNGATIATSNASGTITGTGVTGTITAAGVYDITFTALGSDDAYITYYYQTDLPEDANDHKTGVPEVDFTITSSSLQAVDFPVRSKYSIIAALDMLKAHNVNLENEVTTHLGSEIRFTIDQVGLDMIDEAAVSSGAATAITTWNAKIQSGQEWVWKIREFLDRMEEGNKNIIDKTLRASATFIHAGNNVARVIRQMGSDNWKPAGNLKELTGPAKIGELQGRAVIQNPFKTNENAYTMGYKGDSYLKAGFIVAPYIPLYTTPTLTTSDLFAQKGFFSSVGFKRINDGMYTQGLVSNVGEIVTT